MFKSPIWVSNLLPRGTPHPRARRLRSAKDITVSRNRMIKTASFLVTAKSKVEGWESRWRVRLLFLRGGESPRKERARIGWATRLGCDHRACAVPAEVDSIEHSAAAHERSAAARHRTRRWLDRERPVHAPPRQRFCRRIKRSSRHPFADFIAHEAANILS